MTESELEKKAFLVEYCPEFEKADCPIKEWHHHENVLVLPVSEIKKWLEKKAKHKDKLRFKSSWAQDSNDAKARGYYELIEELRLLEKKGD